MASIVAVAIFVGMVTLVLYVSLLAQAPIAVNAILLLVGLVVLALVPYTFYKKAVTQVKLARMAVANGMVAQFNVPDPGYNGLYFQHGSDRYLQVLLEDTSDGSLIGTYQYTTGSGRSRQIHTLCFARKTLTRKLPHIVLDNVKNNFWKFTNLPTIFSSDQKLSLEGDFNESFTLYAPKEYESDALYVFTPDVMLAFIESGYDIDAEIIDDQLYVYFDGPYSLENERFISSVYNIIKKLGHEVEQQSNYYADERVASRDENVVAPSGKRLKTGYSVILIAIAVWFVFTQLINLAVPEFRSFVIQEFYVLVVLAVVVGYIKRFMRSGGK